MEFAGLASLEGMDITVTARPADAADIVFLVDLYRKLEAEMSAIHPMWPRADGLDEPRRGIVPGLPS